MANTILTHQMIAREAAALLEEQVPFIAKVNRAQEEDIKSPVNSYKKGDTISIRIPPDSKVYDGAVFAGGGAADDQTETFINLKVDTQKHVPLQFTTLEKVLKIEDFRDRFLRPAINTLASVVHADLLTKATQACPNVVGTAGSMPTTMKIWSQAASRMSQCLAPEMDRCSIISHDINTEMVDTSKALFNPSKDIADQYLNGVLGRAQGFDFFESASLPYITNGNKVAGVTVTGAGQTGSNLLVGGVVAADTFKKGQVFTIAGVFATHPLTNATLPWLRQFVVTADVVSAGTTVSLPIFPALDATAPGTTVNALPANAAALTFMGAASTGYRQNLALHKDAYTLAMVPLPVIASCEGYTANAKGISVRVMTFGDGVNDLEKTRIDVLYGSVAVRPLHMCRVTE